MFDSIIDFFKRIYGIEGSRQATNQVVDYVLNDVTTNLKIKVTLPPATTDLKYGVVAGAPAVLNNECYITLNKAIRSTMPIITKYKAVRKWAATSLLKVYPMAGKDINAYYDRASLKFFYAYDPILRRNVYASGSTDVIAHELGHAFLDAIRPDFWSVQSLEIWAFHESFADITAINFLLQYDQMIDALLSQTKNNLRQPNILSRLAEELSIIIYHVQGGKNNPISLGLRDAFNSFKYVNPITLPDDTPDDQLSSECHNFGRVFLGIWYELLVSIFEAEINKGKDAKTALKTASNVCYNYLIRAVCQAPNTPKYLIGVAKAMLAADKMDGSPYQSVMNKVFTARGLVVVGVRALSGLNFAAVKGMVKKPMQIVEKGGIKTALVSQPLTMKIGDIMPQRGISALSINEFSMQDVSVELPQDSYYEFNEHGQVVDQIVPNEDDILEGARRTIGFIQAKRDLGPNPDTMWEVKDKKLTRSFIS